MCAGLQRKPVGMRERKPKARLARGNIVQMISLIGSGADFRAQRGPFGKKLQILVVLVVDVGFDLVMVTLSMFSFILML